MYEIERNIKIPGYKRRRLIYPFREMKLGDSFFVPEEDYKYSPGKYRKLHVYASDWSKKLKTSFAARKVDGGMRVWRMPPSGTISLPALYEIEKNVPIKKGGACSIYPFRDMEIGDSFFVPIGSIPKFANLQKRIYQAACHYGKRNNLKFTTRVLKNGIRVWRIR